MRQWLSENIKTIHPDMTIHDLRIVHGNNYTNAIFDCVVPRELDMTDHELKAEISKLVRKEYPTCFVFPTIDRNFAALPKQQSE